jgi:hypothetical protein
MLQPKILVSIVNYKDPEFYPTVVSLWENAYYKDSIVFSLVSEDDQEFDFSFIPKDNLIYRHFPTTEYYGGLCWARNLATQVDFEYDYFVQFDSHSRGTPDWDKKGYEKYKYVQTVFPDKKALICYAPPSYFVNSANTDLFELEDGNRFGMRSVQYDTIAPGYEFPGYEPLKATQIATHYWTTCMYIFAPKAWVDEVGVDGVGAFSTEEFNQSLRTFAKGWVVYAVGARDVFHQHHDSHLRDETKRIRRPWGDAREESYWDHVIEATNHLGRLLAGLEDVPFEAVERFFDETGIDKKYMKMQDSYYHDVNKSKHHAGMPPAPDRKGMPPHPSDEFQRFNPDNW